MTDTTYLPLVLSVRRQIKQIAAREGLPPEVKAELDLLQQSIKSTVNSVFPRNPGNPRFQLTDQAALLRQHEAVVRTARETMGILLRQLDDLDFRPIKSEADYLMDSVAVNVDNEKLSDAEFRQFIRNSINPTKGVPQ